MSTSVSETDNVSNNSSASDRFSSNEDSQESHNRASSQPIFIEILSTNSNSENGSYQVILNDTVINSTRNTPTKSGIKIPSNSTTPQHIVNGRSLSNTPKSNSSRIRLEQPIPRAPAQVVQRPSMDSIQLDRSIHNASHASSIGTIATTALMNKTLSSDSISVTQRNPNSSRISINQSKSPARKQSPSMAKPQLVHNKGKPILLSFDNKSPIEDSEDTPEGRLKRNIKLEDSVRLLQEEFKSPSLHTAETATFSTKTKGVYPLEPEKALHSPKSPNRLSRDKSSLLNDIPESELLEKIRNSQFLWSGLLKTDSDDTSSVNSEGSELSAQYNEKDVINSNGKDSTRRNDGNAKDIPNIKQKRSSLSLNAENTKENTNNNSTFNLLSPEHFYNQNNNVNYDEEKFIETSYHVHFKNTYQPIQYTDVYTVSSTDSETAGIFDMYSFWRLLILFLVCLCVPPLFFLIAAGNRCGISDYRLMKMVILKKYRLYLYQGFIFNINLGWLRVICFVCGVAELLAAFAGIAIGLGVGLT